MLFKERFYSQQEDYNGCWSWMRREKKFTKGKGCIPAFSRA
jgi:hypothetical protein